MPGPTTDGVLADLPGSVRFALLALELHVPELDAGIAVAPDLFVYSGAPFELKEPYVEWFGTLLRDQYQGGCFFPVLWEASPTPLDHDEVTQRLAGLVEWFLYGVLMQGIPAINSRILRLEAGIVHGTVFPGTKQYLPQLYRMAGALPATVTPEVLSRAYEVVEGIRAVSGRRPAFRRLHMGLRALARALAADDQDERLHQFVRATDALLATRQGKGLADFKERGRQWVRAGDGTLSDLYRLRSSCEHHNDPTEAAPGVFALPGTERGSYRVLQAERLACGAFFRVLTSPDLRAHFADDATIGAFWNLPSPVRAALIGPLEDVDGLRWFGGMSPFA